MLYDDLWPCRSPISDCPRAMIAVLSDLKKQAEQRRAALLAFYVSKSGSMSVHALRPLLTLQIVWVMVPMGQYTHQDLGLKKTMVISPNRVEVSIRL